MFIFCDMREMMDAMCRGGRQRWLLPVQGAGRPQFMTRSSSNDKADNGRIFMIVGILCIACFLLLSPVPSSSALQRWTFQNVAKTLEESRDFYDQRSWKIKINFAVQMIVTRYKISIAGLQESQPHNLRGAGGRHEHNQKLSW